MMPRMPLIGMTWAVPGAVYAGAGWRSCLRCNTSSRTILPSGPEPAIAVKSIPCSFANLRASGDALRRDGLLATSGLRFSPTSGSRSSIYRWTSLSKMRPPGPEAVISSSLIASFSASWRAAGEALMSGVARCGAICPVSPVGVLFKRASTSTRATSSPGAAMMASSSLTGTSLPSLASNWAIMPSAGDSCSWTTLSVSISSKGCPCETVSPSFTSHFPIFPFVIV